MLEIIIYEYVLRVLSAGGWLKVVFLACVFLFYICFCALGSDGLCPNVGHSGDIAMVCRVGILTLVF